MPNANLSGDATERHYQGPKMADIDHLGFLLRNLKKLSYCIKPTFNFQDDDGRVCNNDEVELLLGLLQPVTLVATKKTAEVLTFEIADEQFGRYDISQGIDKKCLCKLLSLSAILVIGDFLQVFLLRQLSTALLYPA